MGEGSDYQYQLNKKGCRSINMVNSTDQLKLVLVRSVFLGSNKSDLLFGFFMSQPDKRLK